MPRQLLAASWMVAFGVATGCLGAGLAGATEPVAEETADSPTVEPEPEFKPPPGYKTKTRGDKVVYCRKELVEGTRFTQDKCYDKVRLKEIESLTDQQRREIDQRRRICAQCG